MRELESDHKEFPVGESIPKQQSISLRIAMCSCVFSQHWAIRWIVVSIMISFALAAIFPIFYPPGVQKITKGTRINILGWISSNISYEQHFILKSLFEVSQHLIKENDRDIFTKSVLVQNYLKKAWGK